MKQTNNQKLKDNQQGVVTIVIVILIMLLMSLIVLAMSRNATREQRQSLDRQLNTQAFYAAESGVNTFLDKINDLPDESNDCDNDELTGPLLDDSVIEVTCVLYDKTPDTLNWGSIDLGDAKVTPIQTNASSGINTLNLSYGSSGSQSPDYSGCNVFNGGNFPPRSSLPNCTAGVLRIEIIRTDQPNRDNLLEKTSTIFIVPRDSNGAGNYTYSSGDQGRIVRANCSADNTPYDCKINITNLGLSQNQRMYLSMRSIYQPNALQIGSDSGSFTSAQITVDSTGKANDVLKRIQTSIPVHALSTAQKPSFSVQSSTDICKLLQVTPDSTSTGSCDINN